MGFWFKKDRNVQIPEHLVDSAFGEVNVQYRSGRKQIRATVLMEPIPPEGTQTGVGIDGSGSMVQAYGYTLVKRGDQVFLDKYFPQENSVSQICQQVVPYLASKLDADGGTTVVYWATGGKGAEIDVIGDLTADDAGRNEYRGPKAWGTGTQLLPALRYFIDRFADAQWGFYVFITDGEIEDLDSVINYTLQLSWAIHRKQRNPVKCVLIGVGDGVNEDQMAILDDLNESHDAPVDIWDHKIAATMRDLKDIFAEVVDETMIVAPIGHIYDDRNNLVKQYPDGVPTILRFDLPEQSESFSLELPGGRIQQTLRER